MFCDHFNFSKNFEFKTNSILDIYKFRSVKSYIIKNLYKTEEEAYKIFKKEREYEKILKFYNNGIKKYISEVRDSIYNSFYNNENGNIEKENIENLINRFYEKLEKIIDFIFGNREKLQKFDNNLFRELLKLNSILSFSLGPQINSVDNIKHLNFHELAPSTMYILIYIIISKLYDIDIRELGFVPNYVENEALICIINEYEENIKVVPILDFINEIYYKINENSIKSNSGFSYGKDEIDLSIDDIKNIFKEVMFGNHNVQTFKSNEEIKDKLPEKNINYFCCNSLFGSNYLLCDFGYRKLFYV